MFSDYIIFEPIKNIIKTTYRCDSKFVIDSVLEMYEDNSNYGIIYVDGNECSYYKMNAKRYTKIKTSNIWLQNQFKCGGQSSNRLARIRDHIRESYVSDLSETAIDIFYSKEQNKSLIEKLIICGPSYFKVEMSENKLIKQFFGNNLHLLTLERFDTENINNYVDSIVSKKDNYYENEIRKLVDNADEKLLFGFREIIKELEQYKVSTIYINTSAINLLENYQELTNNIDVIKMDSKYLEGFGNIIGVRYY